MQTHFLSAAKCKLQTSLDFIYSGVEETPEGITCASLALSNTIETEMKQGDRYKTPVISLQIRFQPFKTT